MTTSTTATEATGEAPIVEEMTPEPAEDIVEADPTDSPSNDDNMGRNIMTGQGSQTDAAGYSWDLAFKVSDPGQATIDVANAAPGEAIVTVTYPTMVDIVNTTAARNLTVSDAYTVVLGWPEGSPVCAVNEAIVGGCYVAVAAARGALVPAEVAPDGTVAAPGFPALQSISLRPSEETSGAVAAELAAPQWAAVLRQDSGVTGPGISSFFDVYTIAHSDGAPTDVIASGFTELEVQLVVP